MADVTYYRGGTDVQPRRGEVRFDGVTGLVLPRRGISVRSRPDGLDRFGGPYRVTNLPPELQIVQIGNDPFHHEIIPVRPMTLAEYEEALRTIVLVPASP